MDKEFKKTIFGLDVPNLPYWNLGGKYKNSWIEDSFVFLKKTNKQISAPASKNYLGNSLSIKRINIFLIVISSIFLIILLRIFYLQIIEGNNYLGLAEKNRQRTIPIPSERGIIYDRQGVQLTKNVPGFSLAIVPQDLPRDKKELDKIINKLAETINQDENLIRDIINKYGSYTYESIDILDNLDYETALKIQIDTADLPGITIQKRSKRLYFLGNEETEKIEDKDGEVITFLSLSHILGYVGKLNTEELDELYRQGYLPTDSLGKIGVEKSYETVLRGEYGYQKIEVDAYGKKRNVLVEKAPTNGEHIKLSIDIEMQKKLEEIIYNNLKKYKKERASAIVIDPDNGQIFAMVSLPAFDNNDFSHGISYEKYNEYINNKNNPLFNRAIGGTYPSGSTIKLAIAAAALQEKIITSQTSFLSVGGLTIGNWYFKDWLAGGHGLTNVRKSIAWSVNTFYYYVGGGYENFVGLGIDKMTEYMNKFNFSKKLGIDLPGENSGFLPSKEWKEAVKKERWYIGDTYNLSIGQGDLLVTPLQIASMTAAIANGGIIYKPKIVKSIINPLTNEEKEFKKEILNSNFIDPYNISIVRLGMRDCVVYGSCSLLYSLPFDVAGKTGTAQWNSSKENHAWFTSFAPFVNPEIVLTVLVEEGEEGSKISANIANEFYYWWSIYRY